MSTSVWLEVLVEDRGAKEFALAALKRLGVDKRELNLAGLPTDTGGATSRSRDMRAWVTEEFPEVLRRTQSRLAKRKKAAILVVTDADRDTPLDRKGELYRAAKSRQPKAGVDEIDAFFWIPRYHIETWAVYFSGVGGVNEHDQYKYASQLQDDSFARAGRAFVDEWRNQTPVPDGLPALGEAWNELSRLNNWRKRD